MANLKAKSFDSPDEQRAPEKTKIEVLDLDGVKVARVTLRPGWKWSECIKPVAGTETCQARHIGTVIAGRLHVVHDDGTEADLTAGGAYVIEPGHDAWVVGDEEWVGFEFDATSAAEYAKAA